MNFPERYKAEIVSAVESIDLDTVSEIMQLFKEAREHGRKIFVCGNTRTAQSAARILCDMVAQSSFEHTMRFRILSLDARPPELDGDRKIMPAERLLVEQLETFAEPGDVVVGISAQDSSACISRALECADRIGCKTVAFTGLDGNRLAAKANVAIHVGSTNVGTVEDTHLVICHMIGSYFLDFERC